jgi:predicted RNA-binding Zn-ribbon protein involved in translation (DUF1610 family)
MTRLQLEVLELFAEASHMGEHGRVAHWGEVVEVSLSRGDKLLRWVAQQQERVKAKDARAYERQCVSARLVGPSSTKVACPNCGVLVDLRPGTSRLTHTGDVRLRCGGGLLRQIA